MKQKSAGDTLDAYAFRRDELMRFEVRLASEPCTTVWFEVDEDASDEMKALKDAWLSG